MADTISAVQNMFKEQYADKVEKLVPESNIIGEDAPFLTRKMEGKSYIMPVVVSNEQGFTYTKANGGAASLNDSYGANIQRATITGQNIILRTVISREDIDRGDSDMKSVEDVMDLITTNAMASVHNRLEIGRIYGGLSIGASTGAVITNPTSPLTTIETIGVTLTAATWSDGIWSASVGSLVKVLSSDAPTGSLQGGGNFRVISVDCSSRTLTLAGSSYTDSGATGNILTLETYLATSSNVGYFFFSEAVDASYQVEQWGFKKIITASSSIFGINPAVYGSWTGQTVSAGAANLTLKTILTGAAKAVGRGFMGPAIVYVNPKTFATLADDEASLRMYDASYDPKKAENGSENIVYHGGNGLITVKTHFFVKEGDAFLVPAKEIYRVGASDVKFEPLAGEGNFLKALEGKDGYELRVTSNQAIFCKKPSWCVYFNNIVNS